MNHEQKVKTQYIAPLSLWVVVRKRVLETGPFIEPAWVGDSEMSGPAIFTSQILAAVYAFMRNTCHEDDDSDNRRAIPLQQFDLLEHGQDCPRPFWCMMAFGITFEDENSMIVATGAPRLRHVPLSFDLPADNRGTTFKFNQWVFDFIRDEFNSLGLREYESQLEEVDEMDDATLALTIRYATERVNVCREPTEGKPKTWGVYDPDAGVWVTGDDARRMHVGHPGMLMH